MILNGFLDRKWMNVISICEIDLRRSSHKGVYEDEPST